jgi:hypothetical protein
MYVGVSILAISFLASANPASVIGVFCDDVQGRCDGVIANGSP